MDLATRDIAKGEAAESSIDAFISRRDKQRRQTEGERLEEELWQASARIHEAKQRRKNLEAWRCYHEDQAERHRRTVEGLIAYHGEQAAKLCEEWRGEGAS